MSRQVPASPRRIPKQERARATVDAIILAAAHIARSVGPDALTTNRIAQVAGVSIGSVYQYFPNKQAILDEGARRHDGWLEQEVESGIEQGAALPLTEGVRTSIAHMVALQSVALQSLGPAPGPTHSGVGKPLSPRELAAVRERTASYLRANAEGLRPVDPELAAVIITRATEALVHGLARDEPEWLSHPDFVDEVARLVVGTLAPTVGGDSQLRR